MMGANWYKSTASAKSAIVALTEAAWRDYLLRQGTPVTEVYKEDGRTPTCLGIPPPFRTGNCAPPPSMDEPVPPSSGGGVGDGSDLLPKERMERMRELQRKRDAGEL
jgi:hypothetical protein